MLRWHCPNHEAAGRLLRRMSDQVQLPQADERVALVDGAPWIRNQIEFHGLTEDIGLDFYHLQENVQKARRALFGEDSSVFAAKLAHTSFLLCGNHICRCLPAR